PSSRLRLAPLLEEPPRDPAVRRRPDVRPLERRDRLAVTAKRQECFGFPPQRLRVFRVALELGEGLAKFLLLELDPPEVDSGAAGRLDLPVALLLLVGRLIERHLFPALVLPLAPREQEPEQVERARHLRLDLERPPVRRL